MLTIDAQFTGNPKAYAYRVGHLVEMPQPGDRVVVPNKIKEDGTMSLSIATVVTAPVPHTADPGVTILPVISVVTAQAIADATALITNKEPA